MHNITSSYYSLKKTLKLNADSSEYPLFPDIINILCDLGFLNKRLIEFWVAERGLLNKNKPMSFFRFSKRFKQICVAF